MRRNEIIQQIAQQPRRRAKPNEARIFFEDVLANTPETHTDCIFWPFAIDKGLGEGRINNLGHEGPADVSISAARLMCIRKWGNSPADKPFATHSCGNGHFACINPYHTRWGSVQDNSDDERRHGTRPSGFNNTSVKATADIYAYVLSLKDQGYSQDVVAKVCGVSQSIVSLLWSGKHWTQK